MSTPSLYFFDSTIYAEYTCLDNIRYIMNTTIIRKGHFMSLTRVLERVDIKAKFKELFNKPRFNYSKEVKLVPLTTQYGLIGTAFDYLARFYIEKVNKGKVAVKDKKWVAEVYIDKSILLPPIERKLRNIVKEAKKKKSKYLKSGEMTDKLIESSILLAKIDIIHRSGYPMEDNFDEIDSKDVTDLKNLFGSFTQHNWTAKDKCFLNPTFGEASLMVGGADADLIIDDVLVDFKTVKAAGMKRTDFNQLMGYYLLNEIGGITNYDGEHQINKIGVYSSRFSELITIDIDDIFDRKKLPEIKGWFIDEVKTNKSN